MAVSGDMTSAGDMAREIPDSDGVSCGMGQACMNGQQCCVVIMGMMATPMCMDSCPDGSLDVMCDGPEDCSGNPCCASVNLLQMSVNSIMCTQAQTDCNPNIFGGMTRLCHVNPDCTDGAPNTQDPTCCTIMQNGNATHICANDTLAQMSGGLLTCP
jgi:hypothetical protein